MNKKQQILFENGFVRVDDVIARVWNEDRFTFRVPKPSDHPSICGIEYVVGNTDFYFVFEPESDQTWYAEVNNNVYGGGWTEEFVSFVQNFAQGGELDDYKKKLDISQTVFSLPFVFDFHVFELRKNDPDFQIQNHGIYKPHGMIFLNICEVVSENAAQFSRYLLSRGPEDLIPITENRAFLELFKVDVSQSASVLIVQNKTLYMYAITLSQFLGTFPYGLDYPEFTALVTVTRPPI